MTFLPLRYAVTENLPMLPQGPTYGNLKDYIIGNAVYHHGATTAILAAAV